MYIYLWNSRGFELFLCQTVLILRECQMWVRAFPPPLASERNQGGAASDRLLIDVISNKTQTRFPCHLAHETSQQKEIAMLSTWIETVWEYKVRPALGGEMPLQPGKMRVRWTCVRGLVLSLRQKSLLNCHRFVNAGITTTLLRSSQAPLSGRKHHWTRFTREMWKRHWTIFMGEISKRHRTRLMREICKLYQPNQP